MRRILSLLLLIGSQVLSQSDSTTLASLEDVWNRSHLESNAAALDSLWADDFVVVIPGMRRMTKVDVLGFARSGRMKFQRYETTDVLVTVLGDSARVTGNVHRARTINNEQVEDHWRFLKAYVRQSGRWRVVSWEAYEAKR